MEMTNFLRVIFYQRNGAGELEKWLKSFGQKEDIVFERDKHFYCGRRKSYEDYLSEEDCYEIDAAALKWAEGWYKDKKGKDWTIYEGISLGKMVEYGLQPYFLLILKELALLFKLKEKENPSYFIFVDDGSPLAMLLKEFSLRYNIKTEVLAFPRRGRLNPSRGHFSLKAMLKRLKWSGRVCFQHLRRRKIYYRQTIAIEAYGKFVPLIKELSKGENRIIVLGTGLGWDKELFRPNIFYYRWERVNRTEAKIGGVITTEGLSCLPADFLTFKSLDCLSLIKEKLAGIIKTDFLSLMALSQRIKKFIRDREVKVIITLQDRHGLNRLLAACGNLLGVKTIEIQHGTLSNLPYLVSPVSKKICVWGPAGKQFYLKRSVGEDRIRLVGDYYLASLKSGEPRRIFELKRALGLNPNKAAILFASQPFISLTALDSPLKTLDTLEAVARAGGELEEAEILIKFHPNEDDRLKKKFLSQSRFKNIYIAEKGLVAELLSLSQILITFCSSIVVEAAMVGLPIIILNLSGRKDFLPIVEMGAALGVYRPEDLGRQIKRALGDETVRSRLAQGRSRFIQDQIDLTASSLSRMAAIISCE